MKRDPNLDSLRGIFLIIMALNHWPGPVPGYVSQPLGLVSSAEGFVFVSGMTAGMYYSRFLADKGFSSFKVRALQRACQIYLMHVKYLALIFGLGILAGMFQVLPVCWVELIPWLENEPVQGFLLGAALIYQPKYFNILPLYILFVLVMPFVLNGFFRGKTVLVLGLSLGIWALAQIGLTEYIYGELIRKLGFQIGMFFNPLGWQMLFIFGLWLGYQRYLGVSWINRNKLLMVTCILVGLVLMVYRHLIKNEIYPIDSILGVDMSNWISRKNLGPIRFLNFLILLHIFGNLISRFPRLFVWRWPSFLGRYSLQVFSFHLLVIYLAYAFNEMVTPDISPKLRFVISLLGVTTLSIPAYFAQRRSRKKGRGLKVVAPERNLSSESGQGR